ncbi:hypothetical protein ACWF76_16080 [Streptomyces globisporus]|uniref:Uncharacterized protein n=1 Tax=Streptomyces globisporus TaxID=1908 RepID=A0A423V3R1_STRGL|nr:MULTISPECIES: hypothetical protein [Streptomyces]ROV69231.1 hypothetical protein D3105_07040 [Streptomyces globisporus]
MNATSTGALLLCRADPETVRPLAHLLREQMLLIRAGEEWSVLVPEGKPWRAGGAEQDAEPVDRVLGGWATALAVGSTWPVLALWWDADRAGYTLAAGFRRPVGYVWLTDGTPVGEDEAMRTFAARLGLDPVLDVQALEQLTRPDPEADAEARLRGLLAVLTGTGLVLPAGLSPGESADRLRSVAAVQRQVDRVEWAGWRDAVRVELEAVESSRVGPWVRGPRARAVAAVQLAAGLPLLLWGARRRSGGWAAAGAVLLAQGALGLLYERARAGTS